MTLLFIVLVLCIVLTVPIAISLGLSSAITVFVMHLPAALLAQKLFGSLDSFVLLAIPFFILAGNIMVKSGISRRLIDFAYTFVGNKTGGIGMVTILSSMFFSAISGSGPATTAAIGSIMIPAMKESGYDVRFASSTQAAAGELGIIIPPSIPLIVYGVLANASVGSLFLAGIIPGLLIGCSLIAVMWVTAKVKKFSNPLSTVKYSWAERWVAFKNAIFALLMPIIILGGIYGGIFTPTEAAVISTVYALVVGAFIYRTLKWRDLLDIFYESAIMSSVILIILSCAGLFSWLLTYDQVPQTITTWLVGISSSPVVFLILINVLLFIIGMFFDAGSANVILVPILVPIAIHFGIDPIHFGIIMIVNMAMGMITPPFGVNLFVVCQIANVKLESLVRYLIPFVLMLICDLIVITYIPQISMFIPSLVK